jgi:hypothetical protein
VRIKERRTRGERGRRKWSESNMIKFIGRENEV